MRSRTWIAVNVLEFFVIEISKVSGNRVFWAFKPSLVNNGRAKCLKGTKQVVLAWCLQRHHCQCYCICNFALVFVFVKISMFWPAGFLLPMMSPFIGNLIWFGDSLTRLATDSTHDLVFSSICAKKKTRLVIDSHFFLQFVTKTNKRLATVFIFFFNL